MQKAKLLHPDVAPGPQSQQHFVQLLLAYEVLSDPRRRSDYDTEPRTSSRRTRSSADVRSHRSRPSYGARADQQAPEDTRSLFSALRDSLSDSLEHASHGPSFHAGPDDFPYAFELEQRVAGAVHVTDEVLQVVVGRTLLGTVKGVGLHHLGKSSSEEQPPLLPPAPPGPTVTRAPGEEGTRASSRSRSIAGGAGDPSRPQDGAVYGSYSRLELHYQGRLLASAAVHVRPGMEGGQGARVGDMEPGMEVEEDEAPYVTIYEHSSDSTPTPLAHVLSPQGVGVLSFRRIISCALVDERVEAWWEEKGRAEEEERERRLQEVQEQLLQAAAGEGAGAYHLDNAGAPPPAAPPPMGGPIGTPPMPPVPQRASREEQHQAVSYGHTGAAWRDIDPRAWSGAVGSHDAAGREAWEGRQLQHMQRDVHARVMQAAMEEFTEGVWRKHTLRLRGSEQAPARRGSTSGTSATPPPPPLAGTHGALTVREGDEEDGQDTGLHGDALAEYLCSPRLHRLSDGEGGVRVDPRARRMLREREERRAHGGSTHRGGVPAGSSHSPGPLPFPTLSDGRGVWNASHWWPADSFDPLPSIPTLSMSTAGRRTWRQTRKGKAYCAAHGAAAAAASTQDHGSTPPTPALSRYATHTLLTWRTPGVSHLRYLRNADGAVEASGSRVSLPPPSTWLWEPRSAVHTGGNFSFELAKRRGVDAALHPAVIVLTSAILALEGEVDTMARHARMEGRVASVKEALGSIGLRLGVHRALPDRETR